MTRNPNTPHPEQLVREKYGTPFMQAWVSYENQIYILINTNGEEYWTPAYMLSSLDDDIEITALGQGFFGKLSAPGYLDQTDLNWPTKTLDDALWELYDFYADIEMTWAEWLHYHNIYSVGRARKAGILRKRSGNNTSDDIIFFDEPKSPVETRNYIHKHQDDLFS